MPRYKITIEYDGYGLAGWAKQPGQPTVQGSLEFAAAKVNCATTEVYCAGRTDAGVHAWGQVAHVDFAKELREFNVMQGLNFYLRNRKIIVTSAELVADDFHARFSAQKRHYCYRILNRRARPAIEIGRVWHIIDELNVEKMREAAKLFIGTHDFSSFRSRDCQSKSPIRTLEQLDIEQNGEEIRIYTSSKSFLHHQVRNMVGTLSLVGRGKWEKEAITKAIEAKNRCAGGPTAPADGLYFMRVDY